jgi:1-acyl-sn-glycerol-3-phosphate acyltransferase
MRRWTYRPARDLDLAPGARFATVRREPGLVSVALHAMGLAIGRAYLALAHRFRVDGRARLPTTAAMVLVANHTSHLDAIALAAALPWRLALRSYPLAAGDVFFDRLGRSILAAFFINALPVWRKRPKPADFAELRARLGEERCVLVLFPEGSRARDGVMGRFKPGLGMLVAGTNVPVVPCRIVGAFEALPPGRRLPRLSPVRVVIGQAMTFEAEPDTKAGWLATAGRIEAAVRALAPPDEVGPDEPRGT